MSRKKVGRNDLCPCGSGLKYKKCCLNKGHFQGDTGHVSGGKQFHDYEKTVHPMMGSPLWRLRGMLGFDREFEIVREFLRTYRHENYTLSIYDILLNQSGAEIACSYDEIEDILAYIYHAEHAEPILWIGLNPASESYVVAMPLTRGRVSGIYNVVDGKLERFKTVFEQSDDF